MLALQLFCNLIIRGWGVCVLFSVIELRKQMNTLESIKVNPSFLLHHFLHDGPQASLIRLPSTSLFTIARSFSLPSTAKSSSTFSTTGIEMKPSPGGDNVRTSQAHQLSHLP